MDRKKKKSGSSKYPGLPPKSHVKYNENSQELFCICRKPDNGELMIGCDGCDDWYHFRCVKLDLRYQKLVNNYYCPYCDLAGKGVTVWKHKCRLASCYNPIAAGSKYCCREHGVQFMRGVLQAGSEGQQAPGRVPREDIRKFVLKSGSLGQFQELGNELKVLEFGEDARIRALADKISVLQASNARQVEAKKLLVVQKDNLRRLNELAALRKAAKKIELCGFNVSRDAALADAALEQLAAQFADGRAAESDVCLLEKKKCLRHANWASLASDEIALKVAKNNEQIAHCQDKLAKLRRVLTVDHYEKRLV